VDAIVLLKEDHKTVAGLFRQFEKARGASPAAKKRIVDKIIEELTIHAYIEETYFYPAARQAAPDTSDQVLDSVEEHHVVVWMLAELASLDPADEHYDPKVRVLIENVRHHVEEEEKDWFPKVRTAMGRNALADLGEVMAAAKQDAPTDPLKLPSATS
jgi:hemerythrin superfamily protein